MRMTFEASSSVTLLFSFWDVHGPAGMILSVLIVFLLTVFYEVLKVWRVWLGSRSKLVPAAPSDASSCSESCPPEASLSPAEPPSDTRGSRNSWLLHAAQTALHVLQVTLGYMLMLSVMTYNTWIFLGVIAGAGVGYFVSFPLIHRPAPYSVKD
ncbi:probable low affinity copper uptake protein 2 [Nematolebias whitei]|uniref:probable low affinity copper uptake protein 2 n=1 Tax=Nematolebias whitei TaxID=451745 RepID=UPI00189C378E|nr:probable low affinity copper uptake protein 2 [Nematolebias whitei]